MTHRESRSVYQHVFDGVTDEEIIHYYFSFDNVKHHDDSGLDLLILCDVAVVGHV